MTQHEDLDYYLEKVPPETRVLVDILMWQNQSDKKEVSGLIGAQNKVLGDILEQTKKTNGRVSRLETVMKIVAAVVGTLLVTNGSDLLNLFKAII